jgi:hypothetical protein
MRIGTEELAAYYSEAFRYYQPDREPPPIHITFYPYIGINHTIRVRDGKVLVRISDICREMPGPCQRGLAYILVGKILGRKIPRGAREVYNAYIKSPAIRNLAAESKRSRGRKVVTTTAGHVYDLNEMFDELNEIYFTPPIRKPTLTWSARRTYRILGHHDAVHDHITISRSLDSADVPRYVVEYVLFHEMLHIVHPTKHINGRRYNHTAAFRRDERKFRHYDAAERWIESNVRKLKKAAKKR